MTFEAIAEFSLGAVAVPEKALRMASTLLVDTLGVAAGACDMEPGRIARDHAVRFHAAMTPDDTASLLFDGRKASIPGAAFAAATQIDNLDAHDGYNPTKGHIGCAVVPVLMAFAQHVPNLSAREALSTLVISYEIAARAGISLHATVSDYHTSGAWNALGAVAIGSRLRQHGTNQFHHALGIAEYHGPRSQMMREIANPTMLHDGSGMGALVGAMAVLLAEEGFEGAPAITVTGDEVSRYWEDLGENWTIEKNYIKPYPICRWAHAAIDALDGLMKAHRFAHGDVSAINVRTFREAADLYRGIPTSTSQAQYSLAFALAVRLVHGWVGPDHIQREGLEDTVVANVVKHIHIEVDERHCNRFPEGRWSDVTVELRDGTVLSSGDVHAKGGPESPMSDAEVKEKFFNMTTKFGPDRQTAIWSMRDRMLEPGCQFEELSSHVMFSSET